MADNNGSGMDAKNIQELYCFYAEHTELLIERRTANNRYFLTVNTAFVALLGLGIEHAPTGSGVWLAGLPVAGILACLVWARMTRSYQTLTKARYEVIHEMEQRLPYAPYTREWARIKGDRNYRAYRSIAGLEALIPRIFAALYGVMMAAYVLAGTS
ncbi:hypothetical protein [Motiliproteus sp. SC1-56]|uniref:RipA family octameric membrane protein n=1 Tax=Motiliproteus sp. SC1-56 TaxID=2799565 RepID=UPI001A8D8A78|nr:hypothetical protein [Motiliproteus sp. SC1-56]